MVQRKTNGVSSLPLPLVLVRHIYHFYNGKEVINMFTIVNVCAAIILSIFLAGMLYGFYLSGCYAFDKEPIELEWFMSSEDYEKLKKYVKEYIEKHTR
jgi:hypothetical protein